MSCQLERGALRGRLFVATGMMVLLGVGSSARAQTTQPASPSHADRLKEVAKVPLVQAEYHSISGRPLTDAETAEIEKGNTLMEDAARSREKGDYETAAQQAREALMSRGRILGGEHHLTFTAGVAARTMARFSAASGEEKKQLMEADKQYAAAEAARSRGDYAAAQAAARRAVEIRERILGKDHADVGLALRVLGNAQIELDQLSNAQASLDRALEIVGAAYGKRHPQAALILDRLGWLGINQAARRGFDKETIEQATSVLMRAVGILSTTVGETADTAEALDNLGTVLVYMREPNKALDVKLRSLVIREALLGPDDRDTAVSLSNLGWLYGRIGMQDEVIPLKKRALAILERAVGPDHPYTIIELVNLAHVYRQQGMLKEAIDLLEEDEGSGAQAAGSRVRGVNVSRTITLAMTYLEAERQEDAARALNKAFDQAASLHATGERRAAMSKLEDLGAVCQQRRMLEDAIRAYEQVRSWELTLSEGLGDRPDTSRLRSEETIRRATRLGTLYIGVGRLQDAKAILAKAVQQSEALHGEGALQTFGPLMALCLAYEKLGELDAAERACEKALRIGESKLSRTAPHCGYATNAMGRIYTLQKKFDLARFSLEEAKEILEKHQQKDPIATIKVRQDLAALLQASGQKAEATQLLREVLERCRELADQADNAHVDATLAKSIKLLMDSIEAERPEAKKEREALRSELKGLLEELQSARAMSAEDKRWLEELRTGG